MENLLPRDAYDLDETGMWKRMPLFVGVFAFLFGSLGFGIIFPLGFKLAFRLVLQQPVTLPWRVGLLSGLLFGVLFALIFGFMFPARARRRFSAATDAIYFDDPKFVVLPPADLGLTHRLPCSWMKSENFAVGGVLYLGSGGFLFIPHRKNLPIHRQPLEIKSLSDITFSLVTPRPNSLMKLLVKSAPPRLQIESHDTSARFLVPEAKKTLEKIAVIVARM